jgi:hypothetical protein
MTDGGKGSRPRPFSVDQKTFDANWDTIFKGNKDMQVRVENKEDDIGRCGCGRSPTGKCIGWHGLSEDEYQKRLAEFLAEQETGE